MEKILALLLVAVIGGSLSACSMMPRVRVLHDPLTPAEHLTLGLTYECEGRSDLAVREHNTMRP
jgi:hypothetical protein